MEGLLNLLEIHLPSGREEWHYMCKEHNGPFAAENRNFNSPKRQVASLHWKKGPTGVPMIPSDVCSAKHFRYSTIDFADMGDAENAIRFQVKL